MYACGLINWLFYDVRWWLELISMNQEALINTPWCAFWDWIWGCAKSVVCVDMLDYDVEGYVIIGKGICGHYGVGTG